LPVRKNDIKRFALLYAAGWGGECLRVQPAEACDFNMRSELSKQYAPASIEPIIYQRWLTAKAFAAIPDERERRYVVMMPLPNVTGALHMGHAMDNVMQDLLIRWHRMMGDNTLWMPGTDHAGIATQAVVEKRLFELEGKTRHDIGREALVRRIWEWKDQYQQRIVKQQQIMGCSCDWDRQRFTMDGVCARAVRHTFFRMFRDGLIYRGNRLVNWDCHLQTAVSDDEIVHETVQGHFWHLRYPVIDPKPGEPDHVTVATTRPETMLGDTAVACHPDPAAALEEAVAATRAKLAAAPQKERATIQAELESLEKRRETHLPTLIRLAEMARAGRKVLLPLQDRPIPLICDVWAKPELGSGCVKITPGHDPNDYDVWRRHENEIDIINILNPDGTLNENAGAYKGMDRFAARDKVVEDLKGRGLLEAIEDRPTEIGHSDRSKTPIEPYLSKQWFVKMGDVEGGVTCGRGTPGQFVAPGLAQAAIDAVRGECEWRSSSGRKTTFHPDGERYASTYLSWLAEKRDWCISRQLWWGHRIPIWAGTFDREAFASLGQLLRQISDRPDAAIRVVLPDGSHTELDEACVFFMRGRSESVEVMVCLLDARAEEAVARRLEQSGFVQDPDVLDTWFSSAIWPHSTLGWPDPVTAELEPGQAPLGGAEGQPDCLSYYYPGSCLVTGRDIITLWVARMVITGLYNLGDVPFTDVFIHANIQDGKGERMSKSKGNGIDPVDIIEKYGADAMRYVLCEMQTGTQDIRLPVQAVSPYTGELIDLATAKHGRGKFTYLCPKTGKEFDVLGTMPDVPAAKLVSERFDVGQHFCNKLWNAARFALMNLQDVAFEPRQVQELADEDRWILSRLSKAIAAVHGAMEEYNPSAAVGAARDFFWSELCDWYLELIKPRMRAEATERRSDEATKGDVARQVLAFAMDQVLRLLHPFVPFITEAIWERLNAQVPVRGIEKPLRNPALVIHAPWPAAEPAWQDDALEGRFDLLRDVVRAIRDIRNKYNVPPSKRLSVRVRASGVSAESLVRTQHLIAHTAMLDTIEISAQVARPSAAATGVVRDVEIYVCGVVDMEQERARLTKQREQLTGQIEATEKKLSNESFVSRAKPEVVERERGRLADLQKQLVGVDANLKALG
jgi:valyl-tRNA synthetase